MADGTSYGVVARAAALAGTRQGELLRILWTDIGWEMKRLRIRGTKTRGSARIIDLGDTAVEMQGAHRSKEREKHLLLGPAANCGNGKDDYTGLRGTKRGK